MKSTGGGPRQGPQLSEADRAAKRKRKKDLEEKMRLMQAEMMELDED